jgi:hypothetical protein
MKQAKNSLLKFLGAMLLAFPLSAQQQHPEHTMPDDPVGAPQLDHAGMPMEPANSYLMQQASGTAMNPASSPDRMFMKRMGSWTTMLHGVFSVNEIQQSGPRGGDKLFVSNWLMGMAQRRLGPGAFQARTMLSLEPATITQRRDPLLLQSGETAFGEPISDAQHPHDLVMELGAQYALPIGERTILGIYGAPVGDPALGPVAFPHRISSVELPQAALGHHLQDSSHIANTVVTLGLTRGMLRIEASGFHGQEPDENRWNFDGGGIDSWSSRLAFTPTANWSGQVSVGRLRQPEAHEPFDVIRSTASVTYNKMMSTGFWAASLIWGRNHKTGIQRNVNSYLAEAVVQLQQKNYLTGRAELVDRDELSLHEEGAHEHDASTPGESVSGVYRIAAFTLGYTRSLGTVSGIDVGLGGNFTLYRLPSALTAFYGEKPAGFLGYLRFRLKGSGGAPMSMQH